MITTWQLPPTGAGYVTDGGLETDLIFHHGVDLPQFAAFPLVQQERGQNLLQRYYEDYAAIAAARGAGLILESATWRASQDWGALLGYDAAALATANRRAVEQLQSIRESWAGRIEQIVVCGMVGPRGDGYAASSATADQAAEYHRPQLAALHAAGADLATAYTLTSAAEAIGIVQAAGDVGIPIAVSFTVETDGRLPDGTALHSAITTVDNETDSATSYFLVNCAHPQHIANADTAGVVDRIAGLRVNASALSHEELDEATELHDGVPERLGTDTRALLDTFPAVRILGGCCGTDARHVAAIWTP